MKKAALQFLAWTFPATGPGVATPSGRSTKLPSRWRASNFALFALTPIFALLISVCAQAGPLHVAGQLLIDVSAARGTLTGVGLSTVGGETNLTNWINYGSLGGAFNAVDNSAYASAAFTAGNTNPPSMVVLSDATGGPNNGVSALVPYSVDGAGTGAGRPMYGSFLTPSQMQGTNPWSVEIWFYPVTSLADPRGVFAWTVSAPTGGKNAGELAGATTAYWDGATTSTNDLTWEPAGVVGTVSAAAPTLNGWHYGVLTYDGTTLKVYLDGSLSNSAPRSLNIDVEAAHPVLFSQLNAIPATGASSAWDGAIAALRVHTGVLSSADVLNNYQSGIAAVPATDNSLYVTVNPVTGINGTQGTPNSGTATLNASLLASGSPATTGVTFVYDTTDHGATSVGWAHSVTLAPPQSAGALSNNLTGLPFSTTYFVRAIATNANNTNISGVISFKTVGPPTITVGGAFFAGLGNETLFGTLVDSGDGTGAGNVTVYWGPTDGGTNVPGTWQNSAPLGSVANGAFSTIASPLTTLGKYFFTVAATGGFGTTVISPSVAFQEGVLFSLSTSNLPATDGATVSNYPSGEGNFVLATGTPKVQTLGGVPWMVENALNPDSVYLPPASFPNGAPANFTINGGTIVAAIKPELPEGAGPWANIACVYFTELGLAIDENQAATANVVAITANSVASVTVTTKGSNYTSPPTVTFSAPGGIPSMMATATGVAVLGTGANAGRVVSVTITSGGKGYPAIGPGANGIDAGTMLPPTVTFSGGGGVGAAGTAVLTATTGVKLDAVVNSPRPVDDNLSAANGGSTGANRNDRSSVWLPVDQVSIVSLVAGSGQTSGNVGDNNYRIYVNGILVEDTDYGFINGVTIINGGSGYTNGSGANVAPTVSFPAPNIAGGVQAQGVAVMGTGANLGKVTGVTMTTVGSGYTGNGILPTVAGTGNPVVTFSAPPGSGTPATGVGSGVPFGDYNPVAGATTIGASSTGYNGSGMTSLNYNIPGFANNSTFNVGQDAFNVDPWSGYNGFIGDVAVYGEALPDVNRNALESQMATKFIPASPVTLTITYTSDANSTITPVAYPLNSSAGGVTTVYEGENQSYTLTPTLGFSLLLSVDGATPVATAPGSTFTFNNVTASHSIALTSVQLPVQQITVTYGAGGVIQTNGVTVPSGTVIPEPGGTSPVFAIVPTNGNGLGVVTVDAVVQTNSNIQGLGSYTYALIGANGGNTNHTLNATFVALPASPVAASIPKSDQLLFSLDTSLYPQGATPTVLTNLPVYYPPHAPLARDTWGSTPSNAFTFQDVNGVIWEQNVELDNGTTTAYQYYTANQGVANGTIIPSSGATIILACNPTSTSAGTGDPWHMIVDVFFGELGLSITPGTGLIQAMVDSNARVQATSTQAIPSGTNAILSMVVQPSGAFSVYFNTVLVITNAGSGPFIIKSGFNGNTYADNITIGDEEPDPWAAFNGLIGNMYVYTSALSDQDRNTLEGALLKQFHAVVPPTFNWAGPNNGAFSSILNWSNTIPFATNTVPGPGNIPVFSLTNAGQTVQIDIQNISVAGLTFNSNVANIDIASTAGNVLTLDSGNTNYPPIVDGVGANPLITAGLNVSEGLSVSGAGTLNLSNVTSINGVLDIARTGSASGTVAIDGGTVTTIGQSQPRSLGYGPGVALGGFDNSATSATLDLNGGVLSTPNIGCVTETAAVLIPPGNVGATAILNFNGGTLMASQDDPSGDPNQATEGSAHLIFNTTHTYIQVGGAFINIPSVSNSVAVPLEHFPTGPAVDGGLTKSGVGVLALLQSSTYTGPTKVQAGVLACSTPTSLGGTSLDITDNASVALNFNGTSTVYKFTTNGGAPKAPGTYGATGSGAANIDDAHFTGTGTLTVLGTPTTPQITKTIVNAAGGVVTLQGTGGVNGGEFIVLGTTNLSTPLTNWTTVATGTFGAGAFSVAVPVPNTVPQDFFRLVIP